MLVPYLPQPLFHTLPHTYLSHTPSYTRSLPSHPLAWYLVRSGIRRARFRDSYSEPSYLEPGQTYCLELELNVTSNLFKAVRTYERAYSSGAVITWALSVNVRAVAPGLS